MEEIFLHLISVSKLILVNNVVNVYGREELSIVNLVKHQQLIAK